MPPSIAPPPPDLVERLLAEHASRFPEQAHIGPLRGNAGAPVTLPIILANPRPGVAAWNAQLAAALSFRANADPTGEDLAKECLVWPPRSLWVEWRARWPAIDSRVSKAMARKLGCNLAVLIEPEEGAEPPSGIAPTVAGVWRRLRPQGVAAPIDVAIEPPSETDWLAFATAAAKPGADVAALAQQIAEAVIKGSTMPVATLFDRWPGLVVAVVGVAAELAGTGAEVTLGNW